VVPRREQLDVFPRLGWVEEPTPITELPELANELGLAWLGAKRDDLCPDLYGGTKVRKLDYALAAPRIAEAAQWISVGAIGSGHLATLTAAAEKLDRRLLALTFWEPFGPWVEENLAFTASGPTELRYCSSRLTLALRHPRSLTTERLHERAVIPPGATSAIGTIGMVRAGLELAEQIRDGELPTVDRIYVPLGTGGTVVGLSIGLALAGVRTRLHAVSAVEFLLARTDRLRAISMRTQKAIEALGLALPENVAPTPINIDRRMLGSGYGQATTASLLERDSLARFGIRLEPIYGGKAMAALTADAAQARGERVLFWHTTHGGTLPRTHGWEERLPPALRRKLRAARAGKLGRRRFVAVGAAAAAGVAVGLRVGFHAPVAGWQGHVLFEWEGAVLRAAAEALVPDEPGGEIPGGVSPDEIALNVDRYLVGMPVGTHHQVHGLFAAIEHATALDGNFARFTRLAPAARRAFVEALAQRTDQLGQAAKGLRDFAYLGYYQDPRSWPQLGYRGPWIRDAQGSRGRYESLVAPAGATPPGRTS